MALPKLTKLELQIMETLWTQGACSVREIHRAFPERGRPAFTTVQTTIYRLESKKALRRTKPVMAHLIQSGKLTLDDIKDAEQAVRALARKDKKP